jgi:hypothetical protein
VTGVADERVTRAVAQPSSDWWRPTRSLATWLTALLVVQAVLALVTPTLADTAESYVKAHRAIDALLDDRDAEADRLFREASEENDQGLSTALNAIHVAVLVLMIVWTWRSAHNARALRRTNARLGPGWAIGGWFIPFANFVLVYIVVSDLWRSSDPESTRGDAWRSSSGSPAVRAWWSAYVGGFVLSFGSAALAVAGSTDVSTTRSLLVIGGVVSALASLLNIVVVRDITARQEAVQARDPAPTERPAPRQYITPPTGDGPGWHADPGGAFDHRYWDGTAWTEHVSTAGVVSTAPVVAPDWYPDPTGRFHWRYWTGYEWTEHVSRDQELFVDPIETGPGRAEQE